MDKIDVIDDKSTCVEFISMKAFELICEQLGIKSAKMSDRYRYRMLLIDFLKMCKGRGIIDNSGGEITSFFHRMSIAHKINIDSDIITQNTFLQ